MCFVRGRSELVRAIQERPVEQAPFVTADYDEREMLAFSTEVISAFGFDWSRGRQDKSTHPFATPIGSDDVRITTRFDNRHPFEMLFAAMHETGHALYEQGVQPSMEPDARVRRRVAGRARIAEPSVGERHRPIAAVLAALFSASAAALPVSARRRHARQFHRGINQVRRSLIRVEADEVTYNLHVMLRVEIEIALLTGAISTEDAPAYWNAKMQEYLGIVPDTDANGILQDMHWSIGLFGYFATYTLGNLIALQLWEQVHERRSAVGRADSARRIRDAARVAA